LLEAYFIKRIKKNKQFFQKMKNEETNLKSKSTNTFVGTNSDLFTLSIFVLIEVKISVNVPLSLF